MAEIGNDLVKCRKLLAAGQLVAIPTETVYGLAGNALDPTAVAAIFATKNRPTFDPLIVHVAHLEAIAPLVREQPEPLMRLAARFWPGPLTLLLPAADCIPGLVTSGLPRVAVRVPNHPLTLKLLASLEFPLAAPSANPFGYISPTSPAHVEAQLGKRIPYILDGGQCKVGIESTIVGMEDDQVVVYRLGGLPIDDIQQITGPVEVQAHSNSNPRAPGQLDSHYAPRTPFVLGNLEELVPDYLARGESIAVLSLDREFAAIEPAAKRQLSPTRNLAEAATNLFADMRYLDTCGARVILAELLPEEGLGRAINDRLRRAAHS